MHWKAEFRDLLNEQLRAIQQKNPSYSLRAFANKLKISPGAMSQIIRGDYDWNLTTERAAELVDLLGLSESRRLRILTVLGVNPQRNWRPLEARDYELLLDSRSISILTCHNLPAEERSSEKIAARLNLPVAEVESVINELLARGHLVRDASTDVVETANVVWRTGDSPRHELVRKYHIDSLRLAAKAVEEVPADGRHCSSMTFVGTRAQMELVQKEVFQFQERLMNLLNVEGESDEVFRFSTCLFPASH